MLREVRIQHKIRISEIGIKAKLSRPTVERAEKGLYISEFSAQLIARAVSDLTGQHYSVEDLGIKVRKG